VTFNEAVAVYLYLQHQAPGQRDEKKFSEAWGHIYQYAEPVVRQREYGSTNKD
jgi:hypothetical protein